MAGDDLFDRLESVLALERLSADGVGGALGMTMIEDGSLGTDYFEIAIGAGTLGELELRLPKATAQVEDGLLILTLDDGQRPSPEQIVARLGPPEVEPMQPGGEPATYYRYRRPEGVLSFEIDEDDRVLSAVVDRTGA